jgi:hypothetical protein
MCFREVTQAYCDYIAHKLNPSSTPRKMMYFPCKELRADQSFLAPHSGSRWQPEPSAT